MRKAIVTGGSGLIGAGLCAALSEKGWDVASFDLKPGDGPARHVECDLADEASVAAAFETLDWAEIDLLVNNGGVADPVTGPLADLSLADWRKVVDSHLTGAFLMCRAAIPRLKYGGAIVNMASTRAFMSEPETEAYAASKGALIALTHALAISLGPRIRVNAIAPGWISNGEDLRPVDHRQHPVGRVGRPDDIAEAVLYLADAGFMTGQVLSVDGGMTRKMIYAE
ncbi:MAG: SDR family NAD(P)-dependent oxidoreductase [Brevundimonas sp.]|uniref:SDR family NAD(P)-dependent oxidoreductase n=1 Tax=Brevundimonas sp. TaxID=1871086 RepID=UPI0028D0477C|nr:SDR family oxidoreductase [uncultured Brevundimonas sp.]